MFDFGHLLIVLVLNTPAYLCAGLALSRKLREQEYYSAGIFILLCVLMLAEAILVSQAYYEESCTDEILLGMTGVTLLIEPVLYLFLAPEGGESVFNRTTIILFMLPLLILLPDMAWELVPGYAVTQYVEAKDIMGVSIYYQGEFLYHLYWSALVLLLQSFVALSQMRRLYKLVTGHGAHYSWKAKAAYYWDFSCGYLLSITFLLPISFWQVPEARWSYVIIAVAFIAIGCLLVYMGFDLNPIVIHQQKNMSLGDFMLETGDVVNEMRQMLEEERVYLEKGLQSDTMAQRLDISHSYFLRMMQAVYNCSFPEWINNARVEYSKGLLRENKYPLEKIASLCGYSNAKTYVKMFKRVTGQTPYEWCHADDYIAMDDDLLRDNQEEAYDDE